MIQVELMEEAKIIQYKISNTKQKEIKVAAMLNKSTIISLKIQRLIWMTAISLRISHFTIPLLRRMK